MGAGYSDVLGAGVIDRCYVGDVRDGLRAFIAAGIRAQTCVTSPPYWGLRDYGVAGQLGLEATPGEFISNMVDVFRLVRDVLADDGCIWVNMGDSYNAGGRGGNPTRESSTRQGGTASQEASMVKRHARGAGNPAVGGWVGSDVDGGARISVPSLKPKDLIGMPWRLAFALQEDGWYLRSDIIWYKPNPMPESINDRPTKAHEYLFLLSKRERYYYDADAITEEASPDTHARYARGRSDVHKWADGGPGNQTIAKGCEHMRKAHHANAREVAGAAIGAENRKHNCRVKNNASFDEAMAVMPPRRNKRTVWTIPSEPFPDAHFATFPRALVEPCILAGSRVGDVVLDPFMGSGTTAQVAQSLGRHWIGTELNRDYVAMQAKRTAQAGLALGVA